MNIEHLVQKANDLGNFFASRSNREEAMRDIASYLKCFWNSEIRREMIAYMDAYQGGGLTKIVHDAISHYRANLYGLASVSARNIWSQPLAGSDAGLAG